MDNEVSISGVGRRSGPEMSRVVARNSDEQGDAHLRRFSEPGPCSSSTGDTATAVRIPGGAVSKGEEFPQVAVGVQGVKEALLGAALMGARVLGGVEWQCDR